MNTWGSKPLNPYAPEFKPVFSDIHCLFLTFSYGFPLTETQIFDFFNMMYEPYVEYMCVHKAKPSLFGKVMFKCRLIPHLLMGSRERVCLCVDGYPMYCKRFVSQKTKPTTHYGHGHGHGHGHEE
ncbi:unnamed protein product [Cochlearia groenlandica]